MGGRVERARRRRRCEAVRRGARLRRASSGRHRARPSTHPRLRRWNERRLSRLSLLTRGSLRRRAPPRRTCGVEVHRYIRQDWATSRIPRGRSPRAERRRSHRHLSLPLRQCAGLETNVRTPIVMADSAVSPVTRKPASVRRAEILEAAAVEFAETGLAGTRLETIAARAGISHPRVVQMFGSKRALFIAVVEANFDRLQQDFLATATAGRADLTALGDSYRRLLQRDRS